MHPHLFSVFPGDSGASEMRREWLDRVQSHVSGSRFVQHFAPHLWSFRWLQHFTDCPWSPLQVDPFFI